MQARTGWMGGLIAMTVLALSVTGNAQTEWDVEWWSGDTETNPYTDAEGVVWGIYEGHWSDATDDYVTDWSTYDPMIWDAANTLWAEETDGFPRYGSYKKTIDVLRWQPGALTFDPPANRKAGRFSLYGKPLLRWDYTELRVGILHAPDGGDGDGSDDFTQLYYAATGVGYTVVDLGAVEELQNLHLGAGERIAFIAHRTQGGTATCRVQFDTTDYGASTVGIRWVPPEGTIITVK